MALTVQQRPKGVILSSTPLTGSVTDNSGDALVNYNSHGLLSGDTIFVNSDYSYYNGFWIISYADANSFYLTPYSGGETLRYVSNLNITFYKSVQDHYFSSVHLPITYRITNTKFPQNAEDTARTVLSFTNDSGYSRLTLSGDIKASGSAQSLEFVTVTVNGVEGIYQIYNWYSDTSITIDLPYDGGTTFGNVQYYYSNYHLNIRVYGGISSIGSILKPVELITEFEVVPTGSLNFATFNINEYLKSKVDILLNDPALVTMPKDINAFCEFYIEYAESYSQSISGYTLGTYTSSYTSDSATTGYAVNSKLPFKNRYAGFMSEYLGNASKFLTMFNNPVLFVGNYYDIAFINNDYVGSELRNQRYTNGVLGATDYSSVSDYGAGLYRIQVAQSGSEDRIDVTLVQRQTLGAIGTFTNLGTGTSWTVLPDVSLTSALEISKYLGGAFISFDGLTYNFGYDYDLSTSGANLQYIRIYLLDASLNSLGYDDIYISGTGNFTGTASIVSSGTGAYVAFRVQVFDALSTETVQVNAITFADTTIVLSEILTIEVNSDCSNQDLYLTWKNPLGGHDYWKFTAEKEYGVDILDAQESKQNINTNWPNSYGEFADTIEYDTSRTAKDTILVRSQNLTLSQAQAMKYIKTSPLVQIMTSKTDRRTVKTDTSSFIVYSETDKLYGIQFTITYTDDIPSQSL